MKPFFFKIYRERKRKGGRKKERERGIYERSEGPLIAAALHVHARAESLLRKRLCIYRCSRPMLETRTQGSVEHLTTGCQSVSQAHPLSQRRKYCNCPRGVSFVTYATRTLPDSILKRFINLVPLKPNAMSVSAISAQIFLNRSIPCKNV